MVDLFDFHGTLADSLPEESKFHELEVASGDFVCGSRWLKGEIKSHSRKLGAIEMEGYGFARTLVENQRHGFLVIRGISDLSDGHKSGKHAKQNEARDQVLHLAAADVAFQTMLHLIYRYARIVQGQQTDETPPGRDPDGRHQPPSSGADHTIWVANGRSVEAGSFRIDASGNYWLDVAHEPDWVSSLPKIAGVIKTVRALWPELAEQEVGLASDEGAVVTKSGRILLLTRPSPTELQVDDLLHATTLDAPIGRLRELAQRAHQQGSEEATLELAGRLNRIAMQIRRAPQLSGEDLHG